MNHAPMGATSSEPLRQDSWWATSVLVGWSVIYLAASFMPDRRLWGFNHLAFLPWMAKAVFAAIMIVALVTCWRWRERTVPAAGAKSFVPGAKELFVLLAAFAMIAWQLRASTALLGDGYLLGDEAQHMAPGVIVITDCLPIWLAAHLYRLVPWELSGRVVYAILSIFGGLIYLSGVLFFWRRLSPDGVQTTRLTWRQWLPVFWFLTVGAMQLFFGYVETYALGWAFLSLFTLAIFAYRMERIGWIWPLVLWVAAFWSHITAVAWLPLLLVEVARRGHRDDALLPRLAVSLIVVAGSIVTLWMIRPPGAGLAWKTYFLPLLDGTYSILNWKHLADALNQIMLLFPAALLLLWTPPSDAEEPAHGFQSWLVWLPTVLAYVVLRSDLGWARDWDLFSVLAAPTVMLLALRIAQRQGSWSRPRVVAFAAVAISSLSMWIWVNANASASAARFDQLLALDPERSVSGREVLARYGREQGRWDLAADQLGMALAITPHARLAIQRGIAFNAMGMPDSALGSFKAAIRADSTNPNGYFGAGQTLWATGKAEESLPYLERAVGIDSNRADFRYHLGMTLRDLGRPQDALPQLRAASVLNPRQPDYAIAYAVTQYDMGDYDDAIGTLNSIIQRFPDYNLAYLNLAWVYFKTQQYDQASSALATYEQRQPPDPNDQNPARLRFLLDSVRMGSEPAPQAPSPQK